MSYHHLYAANTLEEECPVYMLMFAASVGAAVAVLLTVSTSPWLALAAAPFGASVAALVAAWLMARRLPLEHDPARSQTDHFAETLRRMKQAMASSHRSTVASDEVSAEKRERQGVGE